MSDTVKTEFDRAIIDMPKRTLKTHLTMLTQVANYYLQCLDATEATQNIKKDLDL